MRRAVDPDAVDTPDDSHAKQESATFAIVRAEIDSSIATAKQYPRNVTKFKAAATSLATMDWETADACTYAKPQGSDVIIGPSARLAEIIASTWGNLRVGSRVIEEGEKHVIVQGVCHDLETNIQRSSEVRRSIWGKYGRYKEHMIVQTINAAASIAERNAVFRCVPRAVWNEVWRKAQETANGGNVPLSQQRNQACAFWRKSGITDDRVFAVLGVAGLEDLQVDHIVKVRGLFVSVRDGEVTLDEAFPEIQSEKPVEPPKGRAPVKPKAKEEAPPPPAAKPAPAKKSGRKRKSAAKKKLAAKRMEPSDADKEYAARFKATGGEADDSLDVPYMVAYFRSQGRGDDIIEAALAERGWFREPAPRPKALEPAPEPEPVGVAAEALPPVPEISDLTPDDIPW